MIYRENDFRHRKMVDHGEFLMAIPPQASFSKKKGGGRAYFIFISEGVFQMVHESLLLKT